MRKLWVVFSAALLVIGLVGVAGTATAKNRKPAFEYPSNAELGIGGPGGSNTAKDDTNPLDPDDDVISFDTSPGVGGGGEFIVGVVSTDFKPSVSVPSLDDALELDYLFIGRTCAAGSPRVQLAIDNDQDGQADGNAFGYLGDVAFGGGCPANFWINEDMTDNAPKWDLSQFGGSQTNTWDQVESFFAGEHARVLSAQLADDSASFAPTTAGCAYFDDIHFGPSKYHNNKNTKGTGGEGAASNDC